jgi:hypothetical protein
MPSFDFDSVHDLETCLPPAGIVRGTYDPGADGSGTYHIRFWCQTTGALIAEDDVDSPDGDPVAVDIPHAHSHSGGGGVFQCNVRCQFGDGPKGAPSPKCLRR